MSYTTDYDSLQQLTPKQQTAIDLLLAGKNDRETAEALAVHRTTISRWRRSAVRGTTPWSCTTNRSTAERDHPVDDVGHTPRFIWPGLQTNALLAYRLGQSSFQRLASLDVSEGDRVPLLATNNHQ